MTAKTTDSVSGYARKLLRLQLSVSLVAAAGYFSFTGLLAGLSALYGGAVAMLLSLMLYWDVQRAEREVRSHRTKSMSVLYVGAVQRFVMSMVLFVLGFGVLKLEPLAVCPGFALAQIAYLLLARQQRDPTQLKQT